MLFYVILCYFMLFYVILCYFMLFYVILCYFMLFYIYQNPQPHNPTTPQPHNPTKTTTPKPTTPQPQKPTKPHNSYIIILKIRKPIFFMILPCFHHNNFTGRSGRRTENKIQIFIYDGIILR